MSDENHFSDFQKFNDSVADKLAATSGTLQAAVVIVRLGNPTDDEQVQQGTFVGGTPMDIIDSTFRMFKELGNREPRYKGLIGLAMLQAIMELQGEMMEHKKNKTSPPPETELPDELLNIDVSDDVKQMLANFNQKGPAH